VIPSEQVIERPDVHLRSLEFRPDILPMIVRIGAPNDIGGQAACSFETRKCLERGGGKHAAKIPNDCLDYLFPPALLAQWLAQLPSSLLKNPLAMVKTW
jgi:hypothetical protein